MSLIEGGQLSFLRKDNGQTKSPRHEILPYIGPAGSIPLSVPPGQIHHHPGADAGTTSKGSGAAR
jgi:hypothetical protein